MAGSEAPDSVTGARGARGEGGVSWLLYCVCFEPRSQSGALPGAALWHSGTWGPVQRKPFRPGFMGEPGSRSLIHSHTFFVSHPCSSHGSSP